ncbi:NAD(P)/FAD-dependent oxidoreductase [Enterococcus faecalis]|uniref:NAD(P)/FAD-dependent oxidoreductase n=1 Tax=Enterococcus faecalis TaxID=1351 RepID=UPI0012B44A34|nr:pyridine nucleotide-disulfide oxidoreductase [Enterococcus faecalis]
MKKIVIIGSNHAGLSVLKYLLESETKYEITLIDKNAKISYLGCGISLLLKKEVLDMNSLFYEDMQKLKSKVTNLYMETEALDIDILEKKVFCRDKEGNLFYQEYDRLVLATGASQFTLDIPGKELIQNYMLKDSSNVKKIIENLNDPAVKSVAVVGAGYIGVELAEAISKCGKKVYLFDAADRVLSMHYDKPFSSIMEKFLIENNINVCLKETPIKYLGDRKIEKLVTNLKEYEIDMVIQAIGFIPNSQLGNKQILRHLNGAYLTNEYQQTNVKDIYAIGDCATTFSTVLNRSDVDFSVSNALRTGYIVSQHLEGQSCSSQGTQFANGFSIFGYNFYSIGLNSKWANLMDITLKFVDVEENIRPEFIRKNNSIRLRIFYHSKSRRIMGAQFVSKEELSSLLMLFSLAIQEGITVDKLKTLDYLFYPMFSKPYNYLVNAIKKA